MVKSTTLRMIWKMHIFTQTSLLAIVSQAELVPDAIAVEVTCSAMKIRCGNTVLLQRSHLPNTLHRPGWRLVQDNQRLDIPKVKQTPDDMDWLGWFVIECSRSTAKPRDVVWYFGANTRYLKLIF